MAAAERTQSYGLHRERGLGTNKEKELHRPCHQREALQLGRGSLPLIHKGMYYIMGAVK